jgi:hypothetical protein
MLRCMTTIIVSYCLPGKNTEIINETFQLKPVVISWLQQFFNRLQARVRVTATLARHAELESRPVSCRCLCHLLLRFAKRAGGHRALGGTNVRSSGL